MHLWQPRKSETPPCQREACDIQACLQSNGYNEARCKRVIEALRVCCQRLRETGGTSSACPRRADRSNV
ncbi:mature T-cell proliferation 1 neighbor protein-like protein [Thamnocephalis sphaerospora]|uniref:Cx9C motif-containing protein 4, mitochondrial n=1 Tax=Thamnocephalis sphaerospora TaxID=78915 RepID=A0A4V1IVW2_9FUNG|nr:mature T-cell proliferation 1 neighbor protein-like protein [Thamnocephalis sphaerospora]|eukprot:RKP05449.1 mature T-cell proliferation 1 neighbor protein-like protein [Thamnocephalis sphaerospora]